MKDDEDNSLSKVPQPPARTNIRTTLTRQAPPPPPSPPSSFTQPETPQQITGDVSSVAETAARLVLKSVQSGSVPAIQKNQNQTPTQTSSQANNVPESSPNQKQQQQQQQQQQQDEQSITSCSAPATVSSMVGTMVTNSVTNNNKDSPPNSSTHSKTSSIDRAAANTIKPQFQNHHQHHTNSTSINTGNINRMPVPLPWILLSGEYLAVLNKDRLLSDDQQLPPSQPTYYSEIIFVMPADNRGVRGKFYITNFRIYFKTDVIDK